MMSARISVTEAAARMGITPMALRMGLRHGRFPFGTAVKMERRWVYYISRERFERWMSGADMTVAVGEVMTSNLVPKRQPPPARGAGGGR